MVAHLYFKMLQVAPPSEVEQIVGCHTSVVLFKTHVKLRNAVDVQRSDISQTVKVFDLLESKTTDDL